MKFFCNEIIIDVSDDVYYPREDTEMLIEIIKKLNLKGKKVLEVCCGSGILGIVAAKNGAIVTAVDINPDAVKTTQENAKNNYVILSTLVSDLFQKIKEKFDLIVFNPPYLPDEMDLEIVAKIRKDKGTNHLEETNILRQWSGGKTGRELVEKFVKDAKKYLKDKGKIIMVISSLTGENEVLELIKRNNLFPTILERQKIPWEELIVIEAIL